MTFFGMRRLVGYVVRDKGTAYVGSDNGVIHGGGGDGIFCVLYSSRFKTYTGTWKYILWFYHYIIFFLKNVMLPRYYFFFLSSHIHCLFHRNHLYII